ncbi:MAG: VOC family protein [Solirubrobacterales bacterium]|nr:VOC family protein [Solirubrobacterales bacterium]
MELLTSRVLLSPTDLERSQHFYEHVLELAIYREWGEGSHRGVVFFLGGGGLLEVSGTGATAPSDAVRLLLQVRDIHATDAWLRERGVLISAAPERKPWGLLELTATDPDGLELIFVEIPEDHPRRHG